MDTTARQPSWIPTAVFFGCLLLGTAPALGQDEPVQQIPVRDSVSTDDAEFPNDEGRVLKVILAGEGS